MPPITPSEALWSFIIIVVFYAAFLFLRLLGERNHVKKFYSRRPKVSKPVKKQLDQLLDYKN